MQAFLQRRKEVGEGERCDQRLPGAVWAYITGAVVIFTQLNIHTFFVTFFLGVFVW
jgi:hypothetical protein